MSKSIETEDKAALIQRVRYIRDYIRKDEETRLIELIDFSGEWSYEFKRRRQHYGNKYTGNNGEQLRALPGWLVELGERFLRDGLLTRAANSVLVNEYLPGQGIAPHVDCASRFGETVIALSLGSDCVIDFIHPDTRQKESLLLEARSLLVMEGDARYKWKHGIAPRKADKINGVSMARQRRLSITFRNYLL